MIRINNIKLKIGYKNEDIERLLSEAVRQVCLQVFFLQERAIDRSFWNVVWQLMNEQPV